MAGESSARPTTRTLLYNIVTAMMLALTMVVCCSVLYIAVTSSLGAASQVQQAAVPTLFVFPTFTATLEGPTVNPTWTITPTATSTATPRATATPSITPSPTPTDTPVPTDTPPPTETPLPTNTPRPTSTPTPPPFLYVLRDGQVVYTTNFANTAGCNWAGIAGLVYDRSGRHQPGLTVHVTGSGLDVRVVSGSKPEYGQSGWEVYLGSKPVSALYIVQLESATAEILSDKVQVQTVASCQSNLALVVFDKVQ